MSNYTTQLRFLCEKQAGYSVSPSSYKEVDTIIRTSAPKIFNQYPIFDENYRDHLNYMILAHYYQQEIGFETEGQFLFRLAVKMNEIMPYYNQFYALQQEELDLFINQNMEETYKGRDDSENKTNYGKKDSEIRDFTDQNSGQTTTKYVTDNTSSGTDKTTDNTKNVVENNLTKNTDDTRRFSNTPEGTLSGIQGNTHLTDVTISDNTVTDTGTITSTNSGGTERVLSSGDKKSEDTTFKDDTAVTHSGTGSHELSGEDITTYFITKGYTVTRKGVEGINPVDQLIKIRESFLNIDLMVIEELNSLFMQVY